MGTCVCPSNAESINGEINSFTSLEKYTDVKNTSLSTVDSRLLSPAHLDTLDLFYCEWELQEKIMILK